MRANVSPKSRALEGARVLFAAIMYSRGFSTLGCPESSLTEVLALAERRGLEAVELRALAGTVELPAYFTREFGSPEKLASALAVSRVRVVALDTSFRVADGSEKDRAALLEFLPWAEAIGAPWLRVFDGGSVLDEATLAGAAKNLAWWQAVRAERGYAADWMIETHDLLLDVPKIERFVAAMPPSSVRLLWDVHHTWKRGGEDPVATWRQIARAVVHVHVKDSVSVPSEKHPFTYVLPGTGEFPMGALRAVLAAEFAGTVSLEWEKLWHPYLSPLDDALRSAAEKGWW